ncbi:MAG: cytochrome P460 family protein [Nannocystaceae bacterium]|nr:cytochrome P460 family protein [Nannocystaceae bacterium]
MARARSPLGLVPVAAAALACDPDGAAPPPWHASARALLEQVEADEFRRWPSEVIEGHASHGAFSAVFVNAVFDAARTDPRPRVHWPTGSVLVCEGRDQADGEARTLQIMRREAGSAGGGWIWAQYDGDGEPLDYGTATTCLHCHAAGDDYVRSVSFAGE